MSSIPERWASRMVAKGFVDRRGLGGTPSLSALADACGVSTSTISTALRGSRATSVETVTALTKALGDDVADWLGVPRPVTWSPPAESSLLTDRQRKAVEEIIRAMTEHREDVRDHDRPAATSHAGESPATRTSQSPADQPTRAQLTELQRRQDEADQVTERELLALAADTDHAPARPYDDQSSSADQAES